MLGNLTRTSRREHLDDTYQLRDQFVQQDCLDPPSKMNGNLTEPSSLDAGKLVAAPYARLFATDDGLAAQ